MLERFLRIERESLLLRLVAALGAAVALYTQQERLTTEQTIWFAVAYATYVGYAIALRHVLLPKINRVALVYGLILVDVAALLGIAVASQGIGASLAVLLPIFIAYYSTHLGYVGSFFTASAAVVGLVVYILVVAPAMAFDRNILVAIPAFYLVATITGHLGQRAIREETEKRKLEELLKLETGARDLLEVARGLHSNLDAHQLLQDVAKLAPEFTGTKHCLVFLNEEPELGYVATAATLTPTELGANALAELVEEPGVGWLASRAWRTGAPVAARAVDEPLWCHPVVAGLARRLLVIPLLAGDEPYGFVYAFDGSDEPFPEQSMLLAARFGELVNAAVVNARRYQATQEKVELLAAQLATTARRLEGVPEESSDSVALDGLRLDGETSTASVGGRRVDLSPTEYRLLRALVRKAGTPVSEEDLFRETWGDVYRGRTNVVEVYVHRLRRKLEADAGAPTRIVTVRGAGYKILGELDAHNQ